MKPLNKYTLLFSILLILLSFISSVKDATANLLISPIRVVFEDRTRSSEVTLVNNSDKTETYRIGWKFMKMNEMGIYEDIESPNEGELDITKLIRFSPRQVEIAPHGRQKIRLSLRRPADLLEGEYRAHMTFTNLPDISEPTKNPEKGASFALHLNLAFSIPVVVKHGKSLPQVTISNPLLLPPSEENKGQTTLQISLDRKGIHSPFGSVQVFWQHPGGSERNIGRANNLSIFMEMDHRIVNIPLDVNAISDGKLRIVYEGRGEYRGQVWDEIILPIKG